MRNFRTLLLLPILMFCLTGVRAQQVSADAANQLFAAGRYHDAIPMYRQLLDRYTDDPTYNYRLGVCYFLSNDDLGTAYKYLKVASTKDVPNKVYFYLGEVCRFLYRFDESLSYYKRFMVNGASPDVPSQSLELAASAASNGLSLLKYSAKVGPVAKAEVAAADFYQTYDTYPVHAGFGEVPSDLKTLLDTKKGLHSLIFSHVDGGRVGDVSVYTSYGQGETSSKDLYYIQKGADGRWSRPQRLPSTINSPFDEDYAYMCPDNRTLYFASKGIYSIGGYDIYRVTFNSEKQEWGSPENLGFPINSPYDDYLFVPSQDGKTACFASTREVKHDGNLMVFKVDGVDNPIRLELSSEAALAMQRLDVKVESAATSGDAVDEKPSGDDAPAATDGFGLLPEYRKVKVALANNEALTDSTAKKIERLRGVWSSMSDSTRKDVEQLIVFNEKQLMDLGSIHEQLLNRASSLERDFLSGKIKVEVSKTPPVNEWFVQDEMLSVYLVKSQLDRLASSPLRIGQAMVLADSASAISVQIQDLQQILAAAADSSEREDAKRKVDELKRGAVSAIKRLNSAWVPFYTAYYEVMSQLVQSVPATSKVDSTLLQGAQKSYLSAKAIRNDATAADGTLYIDYQKIAEAYQNEQKSLNQLSLYLAQLASKKNLSDSLLAVLNPPVDRDLPAESVATSGDDGFGVIKRSEVAIPDFVFSAPSNSGEFAVNTTASYSDQNPMPTYKSLPLGVVYSYQLGSFSQQLTYSLFRFSPMFYEPVSGGAGKKVFSGIFSSYASALSKLSQAKDNGFKDAFIVAFLDRRIVSLAKARQLEGKRAAGSKEISPAATVMFRVVIGSFPGEMPKNIKDIVGTLLSDKEVIKSALSDGSMTYSIGNFDTFDQAISLKNKLVSEGVVEAFITRVELNQTEQ